MGQPLFLFMQNENSKAKNATFEDAEEKAAGHKKHYGIPGHSR